MNIQELLKYNYWAEDHYLGFISKLNEEQFKEQVFGKSVHDLLYHLLEVYWGWFHQITDEDYSDEPANVWKKDDLIQALKEIRKDILEFAKNENLDATTTVQWNKNDNPAKLTHISVLLNYITHSAYHRGQLAILLHHFGFEEIGDSDINPYHYQLAQK